MINILNHINYIKGSQARRVNKRKKINLKFSSGFKFTSGVNFYQLKSGNYIETKKMIFFVNFIFKNSFPESFYLNL